MGKALASDESAKQRAALFYEKYIELKSVHKVAEDLGVCHSTVHRYLKVFDYRLKGQKFSPEEDAVITKYYEERADSFLGDFDLAALVDLLGGRSSRQNISRRARELGLTKQGRRLSEDAKANTSIVVKGWIEANGHPKGFLGGKHSEESKLVIGEKSKALWENMPESKRQEKTMKMMRSRAANGTMANPRYKASWKQQWAEINGVRNFYRSKWELNYAYYLEWLRVNGQIQSWEHEPTTFWFEGVKRGCVSYLPDFRVTDLNGNVSYHEVKGWMDDRSKTKLRRMKKYHPEVKLVVIDAAAYRSLAKTAGRFVAGWN